MQSQACPVFCQGVTAGGCPAGRMRYGRKSGPDARRQCVLMRTAESKRVAVVCRRPGQSGAFGLRRAAVRGYRYAQLFGALKSVEDPHVPGYRPALAEPAPVVLANEPAVQLVPPGLLRPEYGLYERPHPVLAGVEHARRPFPVGLVLVDGAGALLDVGHHAHPEQLCKVGV